MPPPWRLSRPPCPQMMLALFNWHLIKNYLEAPFVLISYILTFHGYGFVVSKINTVDKALSFLIHSKRPNTGLDTQKSLNYFLK